MKTFEFTEDQKNEIVNALKYKMRMYRSTGTGDFVNKRVLELTTLINYIEQA